MSKVRRDTVAGRAYLDLQNLGRRTGRPGAELMQLYALEGFLTRLVGGPRRDFADIALLTETGSVDADELIASLSEVASHRGVVLTPFSDSVAGLELTGQGRWEAWRLKSGLHDRLPDDLSSVLRDVSAFADPALSLVSRGMRWQGRSRSWRR